ncbi:MAG: haloacid dehalogenase type II, partial [Acetobacteraceae bacterium]
MPIAVFDAYGTLLDLDSAMRPHAARLGPEWQSISREWRSKHIEYTWVLSLAGKYRNFWQLAQESLDVVAARHGIGDRAVLDDVLAAYRRLGAYPDVPDMLRRLQSNGIRRAILSNGEPRMLAEATEAGGIADLLDAVISADAVQVFKPDARVYQLATERFSVPAGEIAFFSSNPWDAFGARTFGFRVFWVNRTGVPDEYCLRGSVTELRDLAS